MAGRTRREFGYIRRLPSGMHQASFLGPDLQRHTAPETFLKRGTAEAWLRTEQRYLEDPVVDDRPWLSPEERAARARRQQESHQRFEPYARRWIVERRNSRGEPLRALTVKDYEQVLERYLLATFGRKRVGEITRADVRAWHQAIQSEPPRSRTKAYGLLRAIMNSAVDDELVVVSPVQVRGAGASATKRRVDPATPAELDAIMLDMPPRLGAAVPLAAWCALRYGELAELRRRDIDRQEQLIKIRRAVVFLKGGAVVGPPKSGAGVRDVAIPPHVWPTVEEHLRTHVGREPDALLFPGEAGGHMWHSVMSGRFGRAKRAAGRDDLRWHDLRHTGATMAAQAGATTAELQARLGHSTAIAAQLYQHAAKGRDRQVADRLSILAGWTPDDERGGSNAGRLSSASSEPLD